MHRNMPVYITPATTLRAPSFMAVSALQRRAAHLVLQQALYSPGACTHSRGLGSVYITCTHTFVCLFVCVSVCDISISFYSFVHALEYLCKYAYISIYIRRYVYLREVEIYPVSHPLISPFLSRFLLLSPAHTLYLLLHRHQQCRSSFFCSTTPC